MKNLMIFRNLLFIATLFFVFSCSKKSDEITPASLTGKWKQNGITGKITYTDGGKSITDDLTEAADNSTIEFNADGTTGVYLGVTLNYKVAGSILTYSGNNGTSFDLTITKSSATQLTLSFTKDQFYKFIDIAGDPKNADIITLQSLKTKITAFEYNTNYVKQ
jgi:hypothetical protein